MTNNNILRDTVSAIDSVFSIRPAGRTTCRAIVSARAYGSMARWQIHCIDKHNYDDNLCRVHSDLKAMIYYMTNPRTGRPFIALAEPFHRIAAVEVALSRVAKHPPPPQTIHWRTLRK